MAIRTEPPKHPTLSYAFPAVFFVLLVANSQVHLQKSSLGYTMYSEGSDYFEN